MDNDPNQAPKPKVPFNEMGQVDSDLTLAKILQEQERAFLMLTMDIDDNDNDNEFSYEDFMVNNDEEYQVDDEIEDREQDWEIEETDEEDEELEDHGEGHHDPQEIEPEDLSYEELIALGELVGTESRGLSMDAIATFSSSTYKCNGSIDECVICRVDYEEGEAVAVLPCKHTYHIDCINKWLQMKKVCPVCGNEVASPAHGQSS